MNQKSTALVLAALMVCAALLGVLARPTVTDEPNFLEKTVPQTFGEWKQVEQGAQIVDPATEETLKKFYKEWLSRTYVNAQGYRIMLSMARSANQVGIQQAHRPEICYPAQGFEIVGNPEEGSVATAYGSIQVVRLTTSKGARVEPVTYWITMGDRVVRSQWEKRLIQFIARFTGESLGGLLFRVSSIDPNPERAFGMQQKFIAELLASVSPNERRKLSGLAPPQP